MAMTKKEQAEIAELRRAVLVAKAFRFTEKPRRDVAPPSGLSKYTSGYDYNANAVRVWEAWSGSAVNGQGPAPDQSKARFTSATQNSRSLYSTRLLALQALRSDYETEVANKLADIDEKIEAEIKAQEGTK